MKSPSFIPLLNVSTLLRRIGPLRGIFFALAWEKKWNSSSLSDTSGEVFTILLCLAEWLDSQASNYLVYFSQFQTVCSSSCLGFRTASLAFISSIFFSKVSSLYALSAPFSRIIQKNSTWLAQKSSQITEFQYPDYRIYFINKNYSCLIISD